MARLCRVAPGLFALLSLLVLTGLPPAAQADLSPAKLVIIPEAIWAPAAGGGTWVTAVQVTAKVAGAPIWANFYHGDGTDVRMVHLATSTMAYQTFRWDNILQAMGAIDAGFDYSGRVGALVFYTAYETPPLWAQAMTTNGDYGKTAPAFAYESPEDSADIGRNMVIPGLMNDATHRTFVGAFNSRTDAMTVRFSIMGPAGAPLASVVKTFGPLAFAAFNPFADTGLSGTAVTNAWLLIEPLSAGTSGGYGLYSYGSIANNVTNDTFALIAIPFE